MWLNFVIVMLENRLWHEKEVKGEFKKSIYFDCYCPMTSYSYDLIYLLWFDFIVSLQIVSDFRIHFLISHPHSIILWINDINPNLLPKYIANIISTNNKNKINFSATVTRKDHIPDYAQISGAPVLPLPDYER